MSELLMVLDCGGQYKEMIAKTVRGLGVYSEIHPCNIDTARVKALAPIGIILSGGDDTKIAACNPEIFGLGIPVLGVCGGMLSLAQALGAQIEDCQAEFGRVQARLSPGSELFCGLNTPIRALMNNTWRLKSLPDGFISTAATDTNPSLAIEDPQRKLFGLQFHPEIRQTDNGRTIIKTFLYRICSARHDYKLSEYIEKQSDAIRKQVGSGKILLGLSGGVDSSVCAKLLSKIVPGQLICVFVDHGLMRLHEGDEIEQSLEGSDLRFIRVNAAERFLTKLKGVTDPERKRKIIGAEFAAVFEEEAAKLGSDVKFLAQGTIYPDIIESGSDPASVIKSHHNVGGLPKNLKFEGLVEPLAGLFKDEVRAVGRKLGLSLTTVNRQPFPGPGLGVRTIGEITEEKLNILRHADHIFREELEARGRRPQQYFAVITSQRSVGVRNGVRNYDYVLALRAVNTDDFMTCQYVELPYSTLRRVVTRITREVRGVSRVVYDITDKPPATIEWE